MNTKQLFYVITLSREGSFSKAADALGISQPSLSQYIKKIEEELGLELFDRTGGDLRITDAGRIYLDAGKKILEIEHRMENAFSDLQELKTGTLIVGAAPYRAASMMPELASAFRRIHPGMHLIVREATTAELLENMEHGEYDLMITLLPLDSRLFQYEVFMEEEIVLAVPASWAPLPSLVMPDRKYPAVDAAVLDGQQLVMLTDAQYMQRQLKDLSLDCGLSIQPAVVVKSLEAQIEMVKAGLGMAVVPSGIERFCKPGEAVFYSFTKGLPRRKVAVAWRKDKKLSKAAEELKDLIFSLPW